MWNKIACNRLIHQKTQLKVSTFLLRKDNVMKNNFEQRKALFLFLKRQLVLLIAKANRCKMV